jgi:hypothetical protein
MFARYPEEASAAAWVSIKAVRFMPLAWAQIGEQVLSWVESLQSFFFF